MRREYSDNLKVRRHHRVVELLRREVTEVLQREVKDPRLHHFTITEVLLDPDIRTATIYVTRFINPDTAEPTAEQKAELANGLKSISHFVYQRLKKRLVMKVVPSIRFEYDDRMGELSRLWGVVHQVREDDAERERTSEL